ADAAGRRESATASLYRFRSMGERVALRRESAQELLERLRAELAEASEAPVKDGATAALEAAVRAAASNARAAYAERDEAALRARQLAAALVPHERAATEAAAEARVAARERDELAERTRLGRERLGALETTLAEREGIPPAARALAEQGERLALSMLDVAAGTERAIAAALGPRASAL